MATGIQTGMRTGSGPLATGRGPLGKPPGGGGGGGLGKIGAMWGGLSPKVRILIFCAIGLLVAGGVLFSVISTANKPTELYATKLSEDDVKEVSMKLTEWNMPHQVAVTNDNILISPSHKVAAQARLASHGLPRHPIMTASNAPAPGGMNTMTEKEKDAVSKRILEGELTDSMRQMDGIADAYVKLGLPEKSLFDEGQEGAKAAVMLKLKPASQLTRDQITGIVNLVAYSVPELKPEAVRIIDTNGRDLTANLPLNGGEVGMAPTGQSEFRTGLEQDLKNKVEQQLAMVLGQQRFAAQVTAEIDFSQNETTRETVGGAGDGGKVVTGTQVREERFNKKGGEETEGGAVQMSSTTAGGKKDGTYVKTEKSEKVEVNKSVVRNVDTAPRIKRLTASVAVDNLKDDQVAAVAGLVRDAIGYDEARGDSITVKSVPFAAASLPTIYSDMATAINNNTAPSAGTGVTSSVDPKVLAALAFVPALVLLALIAVFVTRQRQVQAGQSQLVLGASNGATSSDIADLLNEKSGKTKAMGETRVNTTDQLEKLAKERPTKVAELLKSTWLSQGGER